MIYKLLCRMLKMADVRQTDAVLQAALRRRQQLFPDWDITYIALRRNDPKARQRMLLEMLRFEENNCQKDSCF